MSKREREQGDSNIGKRARTDSSQSGAGVGGGALLPLPSLYRHVIEVLLGWCTLDELHCVLSVSKLWSTCVCTMPSTYQHVSNRIRNRTSLLEIGKSRLAHHVGSMTTSRESYYGVRQYRFDPFLLDVIRRYFPNLGRLDGMVKRKPMHGVDFPIRLTRLNLEMSALGVDDVNRVIATLSRVATLTDVRMRLQLEAGIVFAPLKQLPRLTLLSLENCGYIEHATRFATDTQCNDLLALTSVRTFAANAIMFSVQDWAYLLRAPVQWTEMHVRFTDRKMIDDEEIMGYMLHACTRLTNLSLGPSGKLKTFPALHTLPALTECTIFTCTYGRWTARDMMVALRKCVSLRRLSICAPECFKPSSFLEITCDDLCALVFARVQLEALTLDGVCLSTLGWLDHMRDLKELRLCRLALEADESRFLAGLHRVEIIVLHDVWKEKKAPLNLATLCTRVTHPRLKTYSYNCMNDDPMPHPHSILDKIRPENVSNDESLRDDD